MSIPVSAITSARQQATAARVEARTVTQAPIRPAMLRVARVTVKHSVGLYTVDVLGDAALATVTLTRVRTIPVIDLEVGEFCWVVQWVGNPLPVILGASGAGGGISTDLGVLMD